MPAFANGRTAVSLSAGQAAGTSPALAANPNRTTLVIGNVTATDGRFDVADASGGYGQPLPAGSSVVLGSGNPNWPICPTDAIYLGGFAAADKITFWEA